MAIRYEEVDAPVRVRAESMDGRLERARAALREALALLGDGEVKRGKGGRPPGPNPWKDRVKAYKRAYMRGWRARRVDKG
jgi:hypothetical protein